MFAYSKAGDSSIYTDLMLPICIVLSNHHGADKMIIFSILIFTFRNYESTKSSLKGFHSVPFL